MKNVRIIAITALILTGLILYYQFTVNALREEIMNKSDTINVLSQNNASLSDKLTMKSDTIQNYAITVSNLNSVIDKNRNRYDLLNSRYSLLFDSVQILNRYSESVVTDSTITIFIEGSQKKVKYSGTATYNLVSTESSHSMNIILDTIYIKSIVYLDSNDIIRNYLYADDLMIDNAVTEIDSMIYVRLKSIDISHSVKKYDSFFDRFYVSASVNTMYRNADDIKNYYYLSVLYMYDSFRFDIKKCLIDDSMMISLEYFYNISDLF